MVAAFVVALLVAGVVPELRDVAPGLVPAGFGALPEVARGVTGLLELDALGFGDGLGAGLGDGFGAGVDAAGGAVLGAPPLPNDQPSTLPGAGL